MTVANALTSEGGVCTVALVMVGSQAMKYWFEDAREPKDWDYIADRPEDAEQLESRADVLVEPRLVQWFNPWMSGIATPDELYTLKISHAFWEINTTANWDKHAYDIVFLERKGAQFLRPLYDIALPIWKERYAPHKTKLAGATKDGFFKDAVVRKYDHDSLHRSVAYNLGKPMYERVLKKGSQVDCSIELFHALPYKDQLLLCQEEVMATALERVLIPAWDRGERPSPRGAYHWALRRTVTSLFKGEWSLWICLNLDSMMVPMYDYVQYHKDGADFLIELEDK